MIEKIIEIMKAHKDYAKKPSKACRKWDGKTEYSIHPIWCAMTIAAETSLDELTRTEGITALLYHDVLEDTNYKPNLEERIDYLVKEMTFEGGSKQEMQEIWNKPKEVRLYKIYDKVSNLMDGSWMSEEKRKDYENYLNKLIIDVEQNYGELNITKMAKSIITE
ncbi:MAG: hypothetical protein WC393_00155 [Candidatus Nanoarchaeia archaeon]